MNQYRKKYWLLGVFTVLLTGVSCGRGDLPDVSAFEELGFADAHDAVHRQVLAAYEAWQQNPLDADRNGRLGMLLSAYGKNSAAEALYGRARVLAPGEFRWTFYLAFGLVQQGRYDDAAVMLREALKIDPDYLEARLQLANALVRINEIESSIELYRQITAEYPERIEGWLGLGKALDRVGNRMAAAVALKRARLLGPQYGEVHFALASVLAASGDEEGAAREFAAYERTAENTIRNQDLLIREIVALHAGDGPYMASADYQLRHGEFKNAVVSFRAALRVNPVNQDAWSGLVYTQANLGEMKAAGDTYRKALVAGISYARLHLVYGQALIQHGEFDAARDVIVKAIELDPQYAEALSELGKLEMLSGASTDAIEYFRRLLVVRPNDRRVEISLAQALNAAGQFQEAAARLDRLSADPTVERSLVLKELAIALHGMDRRDAAIETLRRAKQSASSSANYFMLNAIEDLLDEWQQARLD